ncbi:MAG TPA: hypothetical protein VJ752_15365 [Burkholderiaceae bacterium]|nr:hypothetical protein [Burkholderiaceae bacterium]
MDISFDTIDLPMLIAMLAEDSSQRVRAYAQQDGWNVIVRHGKVDRILVDENNVVQFFRTLNDLKSYLHAVAIPVLMVDPGVLEPSADNPDMRERMREPKEVAAEDEWIRQQVQEALDDPRPSIPNTVVKERMAARRAELMARLAQAES